MLFNSYEFIFCFLPVAVSCFYFIGKYSRRLAFHWLILVSLFFYAWWRPVNVLIIAPSIGVNFLLARIIQHCVKAEERRALPTVLLVIGILFNITFLGYFKYTNFVQGAINDVFDTNFVLSQIILPLGVSFITFQKIAFLIDVQAKRIESFNFHEYCLFVLFFPQLIAGPIVHYREMMPQFRGAGRGFDKMHILVGITLFSFGLFKKVFLADGIAPSVTFIFDQSTHEAGISLFAAWMAALGFTLQMYFDFSGYSDMALGAARLFQIRLPANFNSPLRSTSIIDFWLRWHMTLTRFLTAYIYNPMVLALTRRRLARGQAVFSGRKATLGGFVSVLMFPTIVTMAISGLWHGAGYLFLMWGLMHAIYLVINHAWRIVRPKLIGDRLVSSRLSWLSAFGLTFLSVVTAMVLFRAESIASATNILKGMAGLNGWALPSVVYDRFATTQSWLEAADITRESWLGGGDFVTLAIGIPILLIIAWVFPNTLQLLSRHGAALFDQPDPKGTVHGKAVAWDSSLAWALLTAVLAAIGISYLDRPSEFLYWQF